MITTFQTYTKVKLADITMTSQGILLVEFNSGTEDFDLQEAEEQLKVVRELTREKPVPILIDTTLSFQTPTPEAKELLAAYPHKKAEAIVVKYLHQRITGAFFLKLVHNKYKHPVRLFTCKEKAMKWLEGFV